MKFLKAIATPFVAIGRWIKETAWVQPLLIVGAIFAVIFSIPSITNWVRSWGTDVDSYEYLRSKQLSLEGITGDDNSGAAYDFFVKFNEAQLKWTNDNDKEGAKALLKDYASDDGKMLLAFVQENSTCIDFNDASNYLESSAWNEKVNEPYKKEHEDKNAPSYRLKTIFTDQKIDVDSNNHIYDDKTPYEYLLVDKQYMNFISTVRAAATVSNYYINLESSSEKSTLETNVQNIGDVTNYGSALPFFVMIDMTESNTSRNIVTDVFFKIDGSDKYTRADFMAHAWLGTEEFKTPAE